MKKLAIVHLACFAAIFASAADLAPGSPAPNLEIKEWIKGAPIKNLAKDKTYVIEFWATWCGPCIDGIPHLTALAKKYSSITFLGVSVLEDNKDKGVQQFVEQMGDKMGYSVAYSGEREGMAKSWLAAAKQNGIPCAFIVKGGVIQWIGHPIALDAPLEQLSKNTFDLQASKKTFQERLAAEARSAKVLEELARCNELYDSGKISEAKELLAKLESENPGRVPSKELRNKWLCIEDPAAWKKQIVEQLEKAQDHGDSQCYFAVENAVRCPEQTRWLVSELTKRYPDNWYPWLCGARMYRLQKSYDQALTFAQKSRDCILEFQRLNPEAPKGNALDVIAALEEQIRKDQGG